MQIVLAALSLRDTRGGAGYGRARRRALGSGPSLLQLHEPPALLQALLFWQGIMTVFFDLTPARFAGTPSPFWSILARGKMLSLSMSSTIKRGLDQCPHPHEPPSCPQLHEPPSCPQLHEPPSCPQLHEPPSFAHPHEPPSFAHPHEPPAAPALSAAGGLFLTWYGHAKAFPPSREKPANPMIHKNFFITTSS